MTTDRWARARTRAGLLLIGALAGSCSGDATGPGNEPESVTITPAPLSIASLGQEVQFTAVVRDGQGDELAGIALTWTSSDPAVLVQVDGPQFRSVANGQATVTARVADVSSGVVEGTSQVTVAQQAASVTLAPGADTLWAVGTTDQWTARLFDALGAELETSATPAWTSSNPAVATVSGGLVTAVGDGTAQITAASGGVSAHAPVAVSATIPYTLCVSFSLGSETCVTMTLTVHAP